MDMTFFTFICCKNFIVCLKRPKINKKEAGVGPIFKKRLAIALWAGIISNGFHVVSQNHCASIWKKNEIVIYFGKGTGRLLNDPHDTFLHWWVPSFRWPLGSAFDYKFEMVGCHKIMLKNSLSDQALGPKCQKDKVLCSCCSSFERELLEWKQFERFILTNVNLAVLRLNRSSL